MIEWIFFDVDQTLCDFATMMRRALAASLVEIETRWPQLRGRYRPDDLEAIRDRLADAHGDGPIPLVAVRRQMFAEALAGVDATPAEIDEITEHYLAIRFADPVLFDDVPACLESLHGRYKLGVITNGNSKLSALGLDHYFDQEFVAEQIGYAKPDPRIYAHAAEIVGADPSQLIMVGDSYQKDVEAARQAGWRAYWLRRDGIDAPDAGVITSLAALATVV